MLACPDGFAGVSGALEHRRVSVNLVSAVHLGWGSLVLAELVLAGIPGFCPPTRWLGVPFVSS